MIWDQVPGMGLRMRVVGESGEDSKNRVHPGVVTAIPRCVFY